MREDGRRGTLYPLLRAGLLKAGDGLVWVRPRRRELYRATVDTRGRVVLPDGQVFASPSGAAQAASSVRAYDGWMAWQVGEGGPFLADLRKSLEESTAEG